MTGREQEEKRMSKFEKLFFYVYQFGSFQKNMNDLKSKRQFELIFFSNLDTSQFVRWLHLFKAQKVRG